MLVVAIGCGGSDEAEPSFVAWGSSTTSVTVRWQPVGGATGYELERVGRDVITLDASVEGYLDRNLAAGNYTYRLTAIGVAQAVQEASTHTSDVPAIVTDDDAPIGDPVVATVGSAGGMIELPDGIARVIIPSGALPDGSTVTLQAITSPTGIPDHLAIDVKSDVAFAKPIDVSFALDDEDLEDPSNVQFAQKQDDGTWVTQDARLDGTRTIVTSSSETPAMAATTTLDRKLVKFQRLMIDPETFNVKANKKVYIVAKALLSNNMCLSESISWLCEIANGGRWHGGALITEKIAIKNEGTWTVDGPGSIEAHRSERVAVYTAPSKRPSKDRWPIFFKHKSGLSARSMVRFIGNEYLVRLRYFSPLQGLGSCWEGAIEDEVTLIVELGTPLIDYTPITVKSVSNQETKVSGAHDVCGITVQENSPYELITVSSATMAIFGNELLVMLDGQERIAGVTMTFSDGSTITEPGKTLESNIDIDEPDTGFDANLTERLVVGITDSNWTMIVSPVATLP